MGRRARVVVSGLLCASFLLFASGCATVFKGEYRTVRIKSEPDGAMVFVNGEFHGRTPVRLELRPNRPYTIEFRKEGYEPAVQRIKNEIGVGWVILDVVLGVVPVLVDGLTGAWYDFDQKHVNALLERQQGHPLD
jgi:hypothetical protein